MYNVIMYSSGALFNNKQTGGVKRFLELSKYLNCNISRTLICSQDNADLMYKMGFLNFISFKKGKKSFIIPPELSFLVENISIINKIKRSGYNRIVVFDVPPAIGLFILGFKNVILMIRKDMIGYEIVKSESKGGVCKYAKLSYQWLSEAVCMLKAKKIVCQCVYDKDRLKNRHKLLANMIEKKTEIQINNVNPSWIVDNSIQKGTEKYFVEKNKFRVCFIGGFLDSRKGQDLFLEVACKILESEKSDDFEFVLVGGDSKLKEYQKKYNNKSIIFTGRVENPHLILKECDLLVVPSLADSCPNTILEALYNKIPVVGSRMGGIPEILEDEEALFDLTVSALNDKILGLQSDKEKLAKLKMKQEERMKVLTFDWGKIVSEIILK